MCNGFQDLNVNIFVLTRGLFVIWQHILKFATHKTSYSQAVRNESFHHLCCFIQLLGAEVPCIDDV